MNQIPEDHPSKTQHILIAGSSGLIGSALLSELRSRGYKVSTLVRREAKDENEHEWDPEKNTISQYLINSVDVVVNLCGYSIGNVPWTEKRKALIRSSRVDSTKTIARAIAASPTPPMAFLAGSAVGIYESDNEAVRNEKSQEGETYFLSQVTREWERSALECSPVTRLVFLRTGLVLSKNDAALQKLITTTRFGLGGAMGNGQQFWPWISLRDEVGAICHLIESDISGPVNLVGPHFARSIEITKRLAQLMHKPHFFPVPAFVLRTIIGEAANELLLASHKCVPERLLESGFSFQDKTIESALTFALSE